jgi:hypothetical protein
VATVEHSLPLLSGISTLAKAFLWTPLTSANAVGDRVNVSAAAVSITAQVIGTPDGATLTIRGSNKVDPDVTVAADWFTLKDVAGDAAALTAAGGLSMSDLPLWISPLSSGGGGAQSLALHLVIR